MKKIGIMGGTFNPIHQGHLLLAECAYDTFDLDEIIFVPSGVPYFKEANDIANGAVRLEMTRSAIEGVPHYSISDMEIIRTGNTYTHETLEAFKKKYPNTEFYFILGADSLFTIEEWACPMRIFKACTILAAVRKGYRKKELAKKITQLSEKYDANIALLPMPYIEISSSNIRKLVKENRSIRYMVTDKVLSYIKSHNLYK